MSRMSSASKNVCHCSVEHLIFGFVPAILMSTMLVQEIIELRPSYCTFEGET